MNKNLAITVAAAVLVCILTARPSNADVRLPSLFSDHMVLQREMPVAVWGWADKGESVSVAIDGQEKTTQADENGKWSVKLDPMKGGDQPTTLAVKGRNSLTVSDVLIGEVWLGSGQSNMGWSVDRSANAEAEMAAADYPKIRSFRVTSDTAKTPQDACTGRWEICSPKTAGPISAVLYFTGVELHKTLKAPVGLINSSVGGTPIESWVREDLLRSTPQLKPLFAATDVPADAAAMEQARAKYKTDLAKWEKASAQAKASGNALPKKPHDPDYVAMRHGDVGGLFNGKIVPLAPFGLRGVIWYQGENNTTPDLAPYYQYELPLLVADWRRLWGREDLPFVWVQLPNFVPRGNDIPLVREAMLKSLSVPNTGMVVTIDIGEAESIHPKNKQAVGHRLAQWALGTLYGQKVPSTSGPLPAEIKPDGSSFRIRFTHADGGLAARDGDVKGFALAGSDHKFVPAKAVIDGDQILVSAPDVQQPQAVRYAWANNPDCNLINKAGWPASPFRSDDWASLSEPPARARKR